MSLIIRAKLSNTPMITQGISYGGNHKGKSKTECSKIEKREVAGKGDFISVGYYLTGCKKMIGAYDADKEEIYVMSKLTKAQ
ncbi:hypothetical protein PaeBR_16700 [Paenibacillus sp. BR2-3]|uniref:hypothetical protein n=1 Tax=Paenibacillus sp. BR2-3 TaxID=3048494 RepID=UPI003977B1DC